jgi:hypothetical protein
MVKVSLFLALRCFYYLNPAGVEFAEDARWQGCRRCTMTPCQRRRFGKIGAPGGQTVFKNRGRYGRIQIDEYRASITLP